MPNTGRVLYHLTRASGPSGGIKVMLEHVRVLRAAGFDAFAYTKNLEQRPVAFDIDVPFLTGSISIRANDIIIRPETFSAHDLVRAARGGLWQVVFVQNHFYCKHSLGEARNYAELGVADIFCASSRIRRFLMENNVAEGVPVIPCSIVKVPTNPSEKIERIIALPRKRPFEFDVIKHLFALRHPHLAVIPWVRIENLPHAEVLEALSKSTIFLSLQRFEGLGLPALEAMAAGCLVVGFTGDGGDDYADESNGIWIKEDALEAAADGLAKAATGLRSDSIEANAMLEAGAVTVAHFSEEVRDAALIDYFQKLQTRGPVASFV
ncbi:glycosyltransferase [Alphaproteobacteria bacterium]|nr:glycosyltransferase [Alphaproteobacteria bacterium]